jgi:hypothetical protein
VGQHPLGAGGGVSAAGWEEVAIALSPDELRLLQAYDRQAKRASFTPENVFFAEQLAVWNDPRRFLTIDGSRRIGKSTLAAGAFLYDGLTVPGCLDLCVLPQMVDARDTIWAECKKLNDEYRLGYDVGNEQRLSLTHPVTKAEIRFRGAKDEGQAQRLRGPPQGYHRVILDEAQNYGAALKTAIVDALLPAVTGGGGVRGRIWAMGTPSLVKVGFWHDLVHRTDESWGHHRWTIRQNPRIRDVESVLAEAARLLGGGDQTVGESSVAYLREWLGEWVTDLQALVFQFDPERNYYDELPPGKPQTVIGVDLGHHPDSSAIDVEGWWPEVGKTLYGVDEWVKGNVDVDDVAEALIERIERWEPLAVVVDEGGLGKLVAETLRRRKGIACMPAEKFDKLGAIGVLNTDLRAGRAKVARGARAAHDMAVVRWDEKARDQRGELKIAKKPHSDIMDAKLYAHRRARHYLAEGPPAPPPPEQDAIEQARLEQVQRSMADSWMDADAEWMGLRRE